jgi:hypothetical protein
LGMVSGSGQDMVQGDGDDVTSHRDDVMSYSFPGHESETFLYSFGADHGTGVFPQDGGGRKGPAPPFSHASASVSWHPHPRELATTLEV